LLKAAAHAGVAAAQLALGEAFAKGEGMEQDWTLACKWYQLAADQGHAVAQCALAICLAEGFGVKRDVGKAFLYFEKAAAQGDARAQWKLGALYAAGIAGVPADTRQSTLLCKRAAQAGFAPAQATFGTLFARAGKHERAALWWEKAALQGDLEAQFNLANACLKGQGFAKDEARAWELMRAAAQAGLPPAQARLGMAYATGEGMVQDLIESAKWFILASDQGDKAALSNRKRAQTLLSAAQFAEASRRAQAMEIRRA
jgi:TPR repeat protein